MVAETHPPIEQVWTWLEDVVDPEIPVLSVVDLGIVREVRWDGSELVVAITPTYCGCPALEVIAQDIRSAILGHGIRSVRLETRLAPAWTTDWLSDRGRDRLREYGIAPPVQSLVTIGEIPVPCPRCASTDTVRISQYGSTPCKAIYKCKQCLEPFDYFKCH